MLSRLTHARHKYAPGIINSEYDNLDIPQHKYLIAEDKIREVISRLEIDDKLSGERVLAKELGISYMTVRKAIEKLVTCGALYKIPKKGTYVADPRVVITKTKNIGYFLDASIKDGLSSPYYSLVFDALEKEATKFGYALMYCSDFDESIAKMEKIDGAIISCFPRIENIVQHVNTMVPVVCIDNCSADKSIPSVTIDNFNSVVESTGYLFSLGHRRVGFITGLDDSDIGNNRLAGYQNALKTHGIGEDPDLVYRGDYTFETGIKAADYFLSLDERPTAIMCANDIMAIGAIKETLLKGLKVPEDISIIGFDDITIASQMTPSLTTVSAPIKEIAKHSLAMLNSIMYGTRLENTHIALPARLVLRNTCATNRNSIITARMRKSH